MTKRQSKVKCHTFQYFQRGCRMLKIVAYVTKQSFKIISKMGGHFFQSCEYDDMSPHLHQLNGVPPHEPWFQARSSLLSWQNSYPWAWATVLRTRGCTSRRFLLSCQRDFKHQQMARRQKQGGRQLHHLCQDHSS